MNLIQKLNASAALLDVALAADPAVAECSPRLPPTRQVQARSGPGVRSRGSLVQDAAGGRALVGGASVVMQQHEPQRLRHKSRNRGRRGASGSADAYCNSQSQSVAAAIQSIALRDVLKLSLSRAATLWLVECFRSGGLVSEQEADCFISDAVATGDGDKLSLPASTAAAGVLSSGIRRLLNVMSPSYVFYGDKPTVGVPAAVPRCVTAGEVLRAEDLRAARLQLTHRKSSRISTCSRDLRVAPPYGSQDHIAQCQSTAAGSVAARDAPCGCGEWNRHRFYPRWGAPSTHVSRSHAVMTQSFPEVPSLSCILDTPQTPPPPDTTATEAIRSILVAAALQCSCATVFYDRGVTDSLQLWCAHTSSAVVGGDAISAAGRGSSGIADNSADRTGCAAGDITIATTFGPWSHMAWTRTDVASVFTAQPRTGSPLVPEMTLMHMCRAASVSSASAAAGSARAPLAVWNSRALEFVTGIEALACVNNLQRSMQLHALASATASAKQGASAELRAQARARARALKQAVQKCQPFSMRKGVTFEMAHALGCWMGGVEISNVLTALISIACGARYVVNYALGTLLALRGGAWYGRTVRLVSDLGVAAVPALRDRSKCNSNSAIPGSMSARILAGQVVAPLGLDHPAVARLVSHLVHGYREGHNEAIARACSEFLFPIHNIVAAIGINGLMAASAAASAACAPKACAASDAACCKPRAVGSNGEGGKAVVGDRTLPESEARNYGDVRDAEHDGAAAAEAAEEAAARAPQVNAGTQHGDAQGHVTTEEPGCAPVALPDFPKSHDASRLARALSVPRDEHSFVEWARGRGRTSRIFDAASLSSSKLGVLIVREWEDAREWCYSLLECAGRASAALERLVNIHSPAVGVVHGDDAEDASLDTFCEDLACKTWEQGDFSMLQKMCGVAHRLRDVDAARRLSAGVQRALKRASAIRAVRTAKHLAGAAGSSSAAAKRAAGSSHVRALRRATATFLQLALRAAATHVGRELRMRLCACAAARSPRLRECTRGTHSRVRSATAAVVEAAAAMPGTVLEEVSRATVYVSPCATHGEAARGRADERAVASGHATRAAANPASASRHEEGRLCAEANGANAVGTAQAMSHAPADRPGQRSPLSPELRAEDAAAPNGNTLCRRSTVAGAAGVVFDDDENSCVSAADASADTGVWAQKDVRAIAPFVPTGQAQAHDAAPPSARSPLTEQVHLHVPPYHHRQHHLQQRHNATPTNPCFDATSNA